MRIKSTGSHKYEREYNQAIQKQQDKELVQRLLDLEPKERMTFQKMTGYKVKSIQNHQENGFTMKHVTRLTIKAYFGMVEDVTAIKYRSKTVEAIEKGLNKNTETADDFLAKFGLEDY